MKLILYLLLILFALFLLANSIKKAYVNPYKLIFLFGKKGAGKTTYFTKLALQYTKKGIPVYSNVPIFNTYYFKAEDLGYIHFPENSVILLDEVGMIYDNRNFKSFKPEVRDFFKLQRHYKVTIYMASQTFDVDKKLRDLTDEMYLLVNYLGIFSVAKKICKDVGISKSDDENSESWLTENYSFSYFWDWKFTYIPRYSYFFDSFEAPPLRYFKTNKYNFVNIDTMLSLTDNSRYLAFVFNSFVQGCKLSILSGLLACRFNQFTWDFILNG